MGSEETKITSYYIIGGNNQIFENMFSQYKDLPSDNSLIKKKMMKNINISNKMQLDINWEINFIPNITENNQKDILNLLIKELNLNSPCSKGNDYNDTNKKEKSKIIKYNVLIKFGQENIKHLIGLLNCQTSVQLPQFAIITNEEFKYEFKYGRYLTIIYDNEEDLDEIQKNLFSYMIERDGYYNERWKKNLEISPNLVLTTKDKSKAKLNILLIGLPRCGKSTFINLFFDKMIALESPENKPITNEISEYPFYIESSDKKLIQINFTDTPGLIKDKYEDTIDDVIDLIVKKFKKCEDSKDDIHIIYFFSNNNSNLKNFVPFFKFLIKLNKKRIDNNKPKIPIIFIINFRGNEIGRQALEKLLRENNLGELIEEVETNNTNKNFDIIEALENKENIIAVNLLNPDYKKESKNEVYGFENIMIATKYFLRKNNPMNEKDFLYLEKHASIIEELYPRAYHDLLDEKEKKFFLEIKKKVKDLMFKIANENAFFNNCHDEIELMNEARKESKLWIALSCCIGFGAGFIPLPFVDTAIIIPISFLVVKQIANAYGIYLEEIPIDDLLKLVLGIGANLACETCEQVVKGVGKRGGKKMMENFIQQCLSYDVAYVHGKGSTMAKIVENIAEPVVEKGKDNIIYKAIQFISKYSEKFRNNVKRGIESGAENFVGEYSKKMMQNPRSIIINPENVIKVAGKRGKTLKNNAIKYVNKGAKAGQNFGKVISHLLPIINGIFNIISSISVGNSVIEYCEEYIRKTLCIKPLLKRKKHYDEIFKFINSKIKNENI